MFHSWLEGRVQNIMQTFFVGFVDNEIIISKLHKVKLEFDSRWLCYLMLVSAEKYKRLIPYQKKQTF